MNIDTEEVKLHARSLLRKAGLSDVSPKVLTGLCIMALALGALIHFWPSQSIQSQDFSLPSSAASVQESEQEENGASAEGSSGVDAQASATMKVDVEGEVTNPGLVTLDSPARVDDAIKSAGGFTKKASRQSVNLAQELKDGDQVYVASKDAEGQTASSSVSSEASSASASASPPSEKINLNTASAEELQAISGIGPSLSQRIVDYREKNGAFSSVEELKEVSGIGDTRYESMKDQVCV